MKLYVSLTWFEASIKTSKLIVL